MRPELIQYIEKTILPRYRAYDKGHDAAHIEIVMRGCAQLAAEYGADAEMLYVIAAYHDLGLKEGREWHHLASARLLRTDGYVRDWFTQEQIALMCEAIEDHRASSQHPPRSLYGKIIADADREIDIDRLLFRTISYGLDHFPALTQDEQIERTYAHIEEKYGVHGYMQFHLPASQTNQARMAAVHRLLDDREVFDRRAKTVYDEIMAAASAADEE